MDAFKLFVFEGESRRGESVELPGIPSGGNELALGAPAIFNPAGPGADSVPVAGTGFFDFDSPIDKAKT